MRHLVGAAVMVAGLAGGAGLASAAGLGARSAPLGSGAAVVTPCGAGVPSGVVSFRTVGGNVFGLSVSGLPAGCNGGSVSVTLVAGTAAVAAGGPVVVSGQAADLAALTAQPAASTVTGADVVVTGP